MHTNGHTAFKLGGLSATIQSFELTYTPKGGLPQTFKNKGEVFQKEILKAIKKSKARDLFLFHNIKGEKGQLNSMGFIVN